MAHLETLSLLDYEPAGDKKNMIFSITSSRVCKAFFLVQVQHGFMAQYIRNLKVGIIELRNSINTSQK